MITNAIINCNSELQPKINVQVRGDKLLFAINVVLITKLILHLRIRVMTILLLFSTLVSSQVVSFGYGIVPAAICGKFGYILYFRILKLTILYTNIRGNRSKNCKREQKIWKVDTFSSQ